MMHDVHGISGLSLETGGAAATEPLAAPRRGPDRAFQRLPLLAINGNDTTGIGPRAKKERTKKPFFLKDSFYPIINHVKRDMEELPVLTDTKLTQVKKHNTFSPHTI